MNFDDFKYHENNIKGTYDEKQLYFEKLRDTFVEELKTQEKYKAYFNKFNQNSIDSFIFHYASSKADVARYYTFYTNEKFLHKELRYREKTEKVFNYILQKKLWNLQLLWRAEEIKLKEIRTSWDFLFWQDHVQSCSFIPPVTEKEVETLKEFMLDMNYRDKSPDSYFIWQKYDELMQRDEKGEYQFMPEWYEYYDRHFGTASLLLLPNIRGEKENFYLKLNRSLKEEKAKQSPPQPVPQPSPPYLHCGLEEYYKFAEEFEEDKHFRELFRLKREMFKPKESYSGIHDEQVDEAIILLKESEKPIFMRGGLEWREAVIECSERYIYEIITNELDVIYEEYRLLAEIGMSNRNPNIIKEYENDFISNLIIEAVLAGREINGEPKDLKF